jgi:hypothetical protein
MMLKMNGRAITRRRNMSGLLFPLVIFLMGMIVINPARAQSKLPSDDQLLVTGKRITPIGTFRSICS